MMNEEMCITQCATMC